MNPRHVIYVSLFVLALGVQWSLWMGKGGILHLRDLEKNLQVLQESNEKLREANAALFEEIESLSSGAAAVEEHARYEFGMIRKDEVLIRFVPRDAKAHPLQQRRLAHPTGRLFKPRNDNLYIPGDVLQETAKKSKEKN